MSFRIIAKVAIISLSTWQAASAQSGKEINTPVSCNDAVTSRQYNEGRAQMNDHESTHASRTGDLSGLRGEGGFEGDFGKGSDGTLDYWFE